MRRFPLAPTTQGRDVAPEEPAGLTVIDQVGSVASAQRSAKAGVDVVIAQGVEAGGHVIGQISTMALVSCVVDAIAPAPVAAAGGIAGPRGLLAALALGAQGVVMGTRFLAVLRLRGRQPANGGESHHLLSTRGECP